MKNHLLCSAHLPSPQAPGPDSEVPVKCLPLVDEGDAKAPIRYVPGFLCYKKRDRLRPLFPAQAPQMKGGGNPSDTSSQLVTFMRFPGETRLPLGQHHDVSRP